MKLFNAIAIETGSRCTRKCWFCPVAYHPRPVEFMSDDLIDSILSQLAVIKFDGRVELYMYNEPMLDDRLPSIIKACRTKAPKSCIMIATNADLVKSSSQFQELFDAGLNQMQINIYSNVPRFNEVKGFIESTTAVPGKSIFTSINHKKQEYSLEQKFDKKITPSSPKVGGFELCNRSGLIPTLPKQVHPLNKMCVRPFRSLQINWKGQVVICCNDNIAKVVCGDTRVTPIIEIWENSEVFKLHRKQLLRNNRKGLPMCEPCSFKGGAYPHMIAKFWPELGG